MDARDESGDTPLLKAIFLKKYAIVEKLLDNKITSNLNIKDDENKSALYLLMVRGKYQLIEKLIQKSKDMYLDLYGEDPSPYSLAKERQRYKEISTLLLNKHNDNCKHALLRMKTYIEECKWDIADHHVFKTIQLDKPKREIRVPNHVFEHWKLICSAQRAKNQNEIWAKLYEDIMTNAKKIKKDIDEMPTKNKAMKFIMNHLSSTPKKPVVKTYFEKIVAGEFNPLHLICALEEQAQEKELISKAEKKQEAEVKSSYSSLYHRRAESSSEPSKPRSSLASR